MIQDRILKVQKIDWSLIKELQPDGVKNLVNKEALKASILQNGFSVPFAVWQDPKDQSIYAIDGHTRKIVLKELGKEVPKKLTAVFLDAKDRNEAIHLLVEAYNLKSNPFKSVELEGWLIEESIEITEIELEGVDIMNNSTKQGKSLPEFSNNQVTAEGMQKAAEKMGSSISTGQRKIGVICPECHHEFEIQ